MELYSPIENTEINGIEGKKKFAGSKLIEEGDNKRLDNTDILIACIDGDVLPSGTCAEIGIMREKIRRGDHKYIVGICTDNRECSRTHSLEKDNGAAADICEEQYSYQNLYVVGCIKSSGVLVNNIEDAIKFIKTVEKEYGDAEETHIVNRYKVFDDKTESIVTMAVYNDGSIEYIKDEEECDYKGDLTND